MKKCQFDGRFHQVFVDHYFVVVVDYEEDLMFTFERHTTSDWAGVYSHDEEDFEAVASTMVVATLQRLFNGKAFQWPQIK